MLCSNDYSFGPGASCRALDFTLFFSNVFLAFVPAITFTLFAVVRLPHLILRKKRKLLPRAEIPLSGHLILVSRLVACASLIAANVGVLATWESTSALSDEWTGWAASAMDVIAAVVLSVVVVFEHFRCGRPSQLPALYLLVSTLFVSSRLRTIALINTPTNILALIGLSLASRVLTFVTLQFSTRRSLQNGADIPPAGTAGLASRYLVSWALPLLIRGWRKPLTMDDVGRIEKQLYSIETWETFAPCWQHQRQRHAAGRTKMPMFWATFWAFGGVLAAPILPTLIATVVALARPLIILHTVSFVESFSSGATPQDLSVGWGLLGGTFLSYIVYSISTALSHVAIERCALSFQGAFREGIFRKSLLIKVETASEMGVAKAGNLMSVDVRNIVTIVPAVHGMWSALVTTGLGLYIIWTQLGLSTLASIVGAIIFFVSTPPLARKIGVTRGGWAESTDRRVKFMTSVLRHIKAVKLSSYEPFIVHKAEELRMREIKALIGWIKEILKVSITTNWLGNFLALIQIITYTVVSLYSSDAGSGVTTAKIFTVISTITIISEPLLMLGQQFGSIVTAWASFKRIEEFFLCDERTESSRETPLLTESENVKMEGTSPSYVTRQRHECRIELKNATFGVDKGTKHLLKDINVHLTNPNLWMLIGRVGCGKSTMLQSLLGEVDLVGGSMDVELGTVGFCAQDPWLRLNSSIIDNITFMYPHESRWYSTVLRATALDVDLKVMPQGDNTLSSALSGGQKQRVALARAIYGRCNTLVLDDIFSALDADTEAIVFSSLFGTQGLLKDKSVILATNHVYRLPYATWVTVIEDGRVAEQGDYNTLAAAEGYMARIVTEKNVGAKEGGDGLRKMQLGNTDDSLTEVETEQSAVNHESKQGKVAWATYRLYLRGMGARYATFWIGFVVLACVVQISINIYLQGWTTRLNPESTRSEYAAFLGGYTGLQFGYLICFCVGIINAFVFSHPEASRRLHQWQIRSLMATSLGFFESRGVGQIVNRFNSDLNVIDMQLPNSAVNFMFIATEILGGCILIIVAAPYLVPVLVAALVFLVLLQRFYVRAGRELRRLDLASKSPIYTLFSETIDPDGLRTIRAMRAQAMCEKYNTERTTAAQHPSWLIMVVQKWLELTINMTVSLINTLLVLVAILSRNSISTGVLAVALTQAANMNFSLGHLVVSWTEVEIAITSVERVQEFIDLPPQEKAKDHESLIKVGWPSRGSVQFQKVTARYRPELPPALSDVTFSVKPGQRVGICGRSGSGKSTMLGVLWRLIDHEDDGGGIFVDGVDIRDIPMWAYRDALSIIPQDPLLLEVLLRENLDPSGTKSDADIWAALEKTHLKAHVDKMPEKLDELVTADGAGFSRGQRQLLALARAILRQRRILALDEATSSIDVETDSAIQQTIRDSFDDCTVLTIAHRISTVIDYDVIVVMEAGRIVEIGSPQVLLGRPEGHFRRLAVENGAFSVNDGGHEPFEHDITSA